MDPQGFTLTNCDDNTRDPAVTETVLQPHELGVASRILHPCRYLSRRRSSRGQVELVGFVD